jgi:hypothetical protein
VEAGPARSAQRKLTIHHRGDAVSQCGQLLIGFGLGDVAAGHPFGDVGLRVATSARRYRLWRHTVRLRSSASDWPDCNAVRSSSSVMPMAVAAARIGAVRSRGDELPPGSAGFRSGDDRVRCDWVIVPFDQRCGASCAHWPRSGLVVPVPSCRHCRARATVVSVWAPEMLG